MFLLLLLLLLLLLKVIQYRLRMRFKTAEVRIIGFLFIIFIILLNSVLLLLVGIWALTEAVLLYTTNQENQSSRLNM